jgi:DNA-directed RNA polymerase specialized sigma24 family protein
MTTKTQFAARLDNHAQAERAAFLKHACAVDTAFEERSEALCLLAVDEALDRLAVKDPVKAELVRLCVFGGLTLAEAAKTLGISQPAAARDWAYARAWLHQGMTSIGTASR